MSSKKPGPSEFLQSLGNTSQEVADSLRRLGVKSKKPFDAASYCYNCPIAVAVNEHSNGWGGIKVSQNGYLTYSDSQIMDPKTTPAVQWFIQDFDKGLYPDLVGDP